MTQTHDALSEPARQGIGLAAKLMGALALTAAIFLLTSATSWRTMRAVHDEIQTLQATMADGNTAAISNSLLDRTDGAVFWLALDTFAGLVLLAGICFYLIKAIIRPIRTNARLIRRFAAGDAGDAVSVSQLARGDEIGDLARAVRDAIATRREDAIIVRDLTAGDFTTAMAVRDRDDILKQTIRQAADIAANTLGRVKAHAEEVTAVCKAIAVAGGKISANGNGIKTAMAEISTSIDQVKIYADDNSGLAKQVVKLANNGRQSVERGYDDIGEMGVVMLNMQACGDQIVRIAKSIGDISFQTNLLALNASVEAARAGRHGKGFTIVAEEVRNLAGRSSQAAQETSTIMQETIKQVELAAAVAGRINAIFAEMQTYIQESEDLLVKIVDASSDQSGGISHLTVALHEADQAARDNMEQVDEILKTASRLAGQTRQLRQLLSDFHVDFDRLPDSRTEGSTFAVGFPVY